MTKLKPRPFHAGIAEVRVERGVLIVVSTHEVITAENMKADIDLMAEAARHYRVSLFLYEPRGVQSREVSIASLSAIGRYMVDVLSGRFALVSHSLNAAFLKGAVNTYAGQTLRDLEVAIFDLGEDAQLWLHSRSV